MKYFTKATNLTELKAEYKKLALKNHPDMGGDLETMQIINAEFDHYFRLLKNTCSSIVKEQNTEETAGSYKRQFYTENGWAGSRYNSNLGLKEIAKILRTYVKDVYPTWKFSIRCEFFSMGCSLHVAVKEAPYQIFDVKKIEETAREDYIRARWPSREFATVENYVADRINYYMNNNFYVLQNLQSTAKQVMNDCAVKVIEDVYNMYQSYRYDDTDSSIDYFCTNFYDDYVIYNDWKIVEKTVRLNTDKTVKGAKLIK